MNNIAKRIVLDIDDLANNKEVSEGLRIEELEFIIKQSQKLKDEVNTAYTNKLYSLARPHIPVGFNPLRNV